MDIRVLVCDDDPMMRNLVADIVKKQGYSAVTAANGQQALDLFFTDCGVDLVILDVMMPKLDGWDVLAQIREASDVPVLMLTALGDQSNEVSGLDTGANDYIAKPFAYEVLVARINALLRKRKKELSEPVVIGELIIDRAARKVIAGVSEIELSRKEFNLLVFFIENRGLIVTRDQILCRVWGYDYDKDIRTVDTHMKTLRAKLGFCGAYIKTVRGVGYLLEVASR